MQTQIVEIPARGSELGHFRHTEGASRLEEWCVGGDSDSGESEPCRTSLEALTRAAAHLRDRDTPVGFPTETVYGLGADATRSAAVRGIYAAKGRPADNPLIVHVCDLRMLRSLLPPRGNSDGGSGGGGGEDGDDTTETTAPPIPERYRTLIDRFWPGPLTILLPNAQPSSRLAPEVTAGLTTFGARMPASPLALTLIRLAGVPLAAPSANASTRPSPTTAAHVRDDLAGRIELVLDGGACAVGVESTVVDGLCEPPVVLRPGGVSVDRLRACPGWEKVVAAYSDKTHDGRRRGGGGDGGQEGCAEAAPRAPGMKYKHYSPRARVVLYEATCGAASSGVAPADAESIVAATATEAAAAEGREEGGPLEWRRSAATTAGMPRVGVIRTRRWKAAAGLAVRDWREASPLASVAAHQPAYQVFMGGLVGRDGQSVVGQLFDVDLGRDTEAIAQGLFWALRELDSRETDIIFVDGIDGEMDMAAAIMNRLRKAASELRS